MEYEKLEGKKVQLLQVRDFPPDLYQTISKVAREENRSVPQETIVLLRTALGITGERKARQRAVFKEIDSFNLKNTDSFPDPAQLTREDRDL